MIKNYTPSEWKTNTEYNLCFDDGHHNGFAFPCTEAGEPILNDCNRSNYEFCVANPERFVRYNKVVKYSWRYRQNAHGTCYCGEEIELYDQYLGACQCEKCGQWWNMSGQALVPPSEWEEDY